LLRDQNDGSRETSTANAEVVSVIPQNESLDDFR